MSTWLFLNSLGLALLGGIVYLLLRQVGFILRRVGPVGARGTSDGPRIGENIAHHLPQIVQGELRAKAKLLAFVSHECSICEVIREGAQELAKAWNRDACILLIYDSPHAMNDLPLKSLAPALFEMQAFGLRRALGATFVPFAVVLDAAGTVVGKGLVNEIGHLESLLEQQRAASQQTTRPSVDVATGLRRA